MAAPAAALVSRISIVFLYVSDVERAARFYRDVLGIPLEGDSQWQETTFPGGVRFAIHASHGEAELGSGTIALNFEVADIDEAAERVRAAGVEVGEIERESWGSAAQVVDPDGYRLELYQPPSG